MHILFLCNPSAYGGAEAHTLRLADNLARHGHSVIIAEVNSDIYSNEIRRLQLPIAARRIDTGRHISKISIMQWWYVLREFRIDCSILAKGCFADDSWKLGLVLWMISDYVISIEHSLPARISHIRGAPYFGIVPRLGLWRIFARYRGKLLQCWRASTVCVCGAARKVLIEEYRYCPGRVHVIPNGVDTKRFTREEKGLSRHALGIPHDALVFGVISRLSVEKNLDLAVTAFNDLVEQAPKARTRLVIVGDGPERKKLQTLAANSPASNMIQFFDYTVSPEKFFPLLDFFLLTSIYEGMPLALLEAMASGCIPIASNVGGVSEVVLEGHNGFVFTPCDADELLEQMLRAVHLTLDARTELGARARQDMVSSFEAGRQMDRLVSAIIQVNDSAK